MSRDERRGGRRWIRIAFAGLIAAGVGSYFFGRVKIELNLDPWLSLPMAPLEVGEGLAESARVPAQPGDLRGHSLLLVTLDTTRPDRLGCYGNDEIETPWLDRVAARGVLFSNAVATTSMTLPTHASILTGLYPHRHQARANFEHMLSDGALTLAEILSASGYRTGAFVSSVVLKARYGLAQGFDRYDFHLGSQRVDGPERRSAGETTDAAITWLGLQPDRPFFAWVHYYDAHSPYMAPREFAARFTNPFDAQIAYMDQQFGRLLEFIDQGVSGEKIVVVVGDHGEALGEHGERDHGYLVQEATIRIPWILYASSGLKRGVHVPTRVSQIDLLPTLLSLLGIPVPEGLDGIDLTGTADPERALVTEAVSGHLLFGWAPIAGVYRGGAKYVQGPSPEFYDLDADPLEAENLYAQRQVEAGELAALLRRLRGPEADRVPQAQMTLSPEEIEQLRALGYVETGVALGARAASGPDPKEMIPIDNELFSIVAAVDRYQYLTALDRIVLRLAGRPVVADQEALVGELEKFARVYPAFAPTYRQLEIAYRKLGLEGAAAWARERLVELTTKAGED